jgi:hypothetical protein
MTIELVLEVYKRWCPLNVCITDGEHAEQQMEVYTGNRSSGGYESEAKLGRDRQGCTIQCSISNQTVAECVLARWESERDGNSEVFCPERRISLSWIRARTASQPVTLAWTLNGYRRLQVYIVTTPAFELKPRVHCFEIGEVRMIEIFQGSSLC